MAQPRPAGPAQRGRSSSRWYRASTSQFCTQESSLVRRSTMQALLSSKVPPPVAGGDDPVALQRYVVMAAITETILEQGLDADSPTAYLGALMAALTVSKKWDGSCPGLAPLVP
jgi:hypothetical protein